MPPRARHLVSSAGYSLSSYFHSNKFFCQFVSYTFVVTSVAAVLFTALQANSDHTISLFDAWFLAISCFSCTGLATVEYYEFRVTTLVVMLLTIELGNMVMCSAGPSMLRLLTLHRKLDEVRNAEDSAEVRTYERKIVLQVIVNRTIVWFCTVYVLAAHTVLFLLVLAAGQTGWWALFHTVTGLNNAGFALQKENFAISSIASDQFLLFAFILAMPMGNTLYPVYQRLMLFGVQTVLRKMDLTATSHWYLFGMSTMDLSIGLTELFANPRRYYTHLFGVKQTVYLFMMWGIMTVVDFCMFIPELGSDSNVFVSHDSEFTEALFQTITTRTTGFTLINMTNVRQGHISWWIMAMYLSSYPFIISERSTREAPIHDEDEFSAMPKAFEGLPSDVFADREPLALDDSSVTDTAPQPRALQHSSSLESVDDPRAPRAFAQTRRGAYDTSNEVASECSATVVSLLGGTPQTNDEPVLSATQNNFPSSKSSSLCETFVSASRGRRDAHHRTHSLAYSFAPETMSRGRASSLFTAQSNRPRRDLRGLIAAVSDRKNIRTEVANIKQEATNTIAREMIWLYLAIVFISYFEGHALEGQDSTGQSAWCRLVFEVASAYGTVGLSLSSPQHPTVAFTACFNDASMFVIIMIMYCGKFRGLPQTMDISDVECLRVAPRALPSVHQLVAHLNISDDLRAEETANENNDDSTEDTFVLPNRHVGFTIDSSSSEEGVAYLQLAREDEQEGGRLVNDTTSSRRHTAMF
eukprot:PhM_4_TR3072/c2_g2_i4/m.102566